MLAAAKGSGPFIYIHRRLHPDSGAVSGNSPTPADDYPLPAYVRRLCCFEPLGYVQEKEME